MQKPAQRKFHYIYKTTCLISGRWYLGMHSTDNLEDGYLGSGQVLWKSIKKYGKDKHVREILEFLDSRLALIQREEQIITAEIRADPNCMNLRNGGTGQAPGFNATEQAKAKMSAASKAAIRTPEWYAKVVSTRTANGSYVHTDETKAKISKRFLGTTLSAEHKEKISRGLEGREVSEETRRKIAEGNRITQTGVPKGPKSIEHREKLRIAQTGKKYSDESRAKMSEKAKLRPAPKGRSCTVDGVTIYESVAALIRALGQGKNGVNSPNFRYVDVS